MINRGKWLALAIATTGLIVACSSPQQVPFNCEIPSATSPLPKSPTLNIAMYVDGTPSMQGYVNHPTNARTRYIQTIDLLDQTLLTGWTPAPRNQLQVEYYRLGETFNKINRKDYLLARQTKFYSGTDANLPLLRVSRIENAITPATDDKLTVIVTDLYQEDEDVTQLNRKIIQQNYFNPSNPGYAVGILAIKGEFNGDVYLEDGTNRKFVYTTNDSQGNAIKGKDFRPFYVIFLGRYSDISDYFNNLSNTKKLPEGSQLTIFSPSDLVKNVSYLQESPKTPEGLQKVQALNSDRLTIDNQDKIELLAIDKGFTQDLPVNYQVPFQPLNHTLLVDPDFIQTEINIQTSAASINSQQPESSDVATALQKLPPNHQMYKALEFSQWKIDNNNLSFLTTIKTNIFTESEIYLFTVDAIAKKVQTESWWSDWNANTNISNDWRTYNLLPFMEGLKNSTDNFLQNNKVVVGRYCYGIQKN
jgi:hypothetical protein